MIYTFYSYKGGVGRSMALANVAEWFYLRGLRVVMIDWDVEAPGLENYFYSSETDLDEIRSQLGLIDIVSSYKRHFPRLPLPANGDTLTLLKEYLPPLSHALYPIRGGDAAFDRRDPALFLLPAGWRSGDRFAAYAQAVQSFDWSELYTLYEGEIYFEWLRRQLLDDKFADVVLIDSRTGVTEVSGICSRQLADVVVACCVPSAQNLRSIGTMVRSFKRNEPLQARKGRPLDIVVVPTRVEESAPGVREEFEAAFHKLDLSTPEGFEQADVTPWDLRLPYVAKYVSSETLAVGGKRKEEDELASAYRNLAIHLARLAPKDSRLHAMLEDIEQVEDSRTQSKALTLADPSAVTLRGAANGEEAEIILGSVYYPGVTIESSQRTRFVTPSVPSPFVRHAELEEVVAELIERQSDDLGLPIVGLYGMAGSGKTVLAAAACRDERLTEVFPDGVLWITLGATPGNLAGQLEECIARLTNSRPGITNVEVAAAYLARLLRKRRVLLVIDDVWNPSHLKPFLKGGPRCGRLITTRDVDTLPPNCTQINLDVMQPREAVELLGADLPAGHEPELQAIVASLGRQVLPIVLALANGVLRRKIATEGTWTGALSRALGYLDHTLGEQDSPSHEAREAGETSVEASDALDAALGMLNKEERARYEELSIFVQDVSIPLAVVEKLWNAVGGLSSINTEKLCVHLDELSLLHFDQTARKIQLHPVLRNYLAKHQSRDLPTLHRQLLDAYRPVSPATWANISDEEQYFWDNLSYHLIEADLVDELIATVSDVRYLVAKTFNRGALAVEEDLLAAEVHRPRDHVLTTLRSNFVNAAHLLNQCRRRQDIASTLHSRIAHQPALVETASKTEAELPRPLVTARYPLPDLPDPSLDRTFLGHENRVRGCDINADGSMVISASADSTTRIWDTLRGTELTTLTEHAEPVPVRSCAISRDGKVVVSAFEDGTLEVWDPASSTQRVTLVGHTAAVSDCAISSDNERIVSASEDNTLRLWEVTTGKQIQEFRGHQAAVKGCAISAYGSAIISASLDGTIKVWDAENGKEVKTLLGHSAGVRACAISANGDRAVSASRDSTLKVWDVERGVATSTLEGHEGGVNGCAINDNGTVIVSAGRDNTIKVWDAENGKEVKTLLGHSDWVKDCAISADGVVVVSASDDRTLKVWNAHRDVGPLTVSRYGTRVNDLSVSADGTLIACASDDGTLTLWDAPTGSVRTLSRSHRAAILGCAISPKKHIVVSASRDTTLEVWATSTGELLRTFHGHDSEVRCCAVSSDARILVSGSADHTLKLWNLQTGEHIRDLTGHRAGVLACAISPDDSRVISGSDDCTIRVWDAMKGADLRTLYGHTGWVMDCAFSPSGRLIVSASADGTLKVWDVSSGAERLTLSGHQAGVFGCAFSSDGSKIVSVSGDHTLRVWDALNGNCLTTLHVDGRLSACAWPSEHEITAVGSRGVYFLRLVPGPEQDTNVGRKWTQIRKLSRRHLTRKDRQPEMTNDGRLKTVNDRPPPVPPEVETHPAWYRLNDQLSWYDRKSGEHQRWYKRIKRSQITIAAVIPVVSFLQVPWVPYATAILGALIAILEGLQQLGQHHNLWTTYRTTAEQLKHEKYLFLSSSGPYRDLDTSKALGQLSERVEELVSTEHAKWVSDTKQIEQPRSDQVPATTGVTGGGKKGRG